MSQFRLARLFLMLAAIGLNTAPALMNSAHAQKKDDKAAPAQPAGPTVRPEVYKLIDPTAVKAAMDAKNYADVQGRITQAEAIPNLTPYETYAINRMKLSLGVTTNNDAISLPALEAVINSGFLQPQEKDAFVQSLANMYYNAKNYPKAIEWLKRYQKESPTPEKVRAALVRSYYLSGDYASAKAELMPLIAEADKTGKAPSEEDLKLLASSANKAKDDATYLLAIEKLAAFYPSDDYWTDTLSRGVVRKAGFNTQDFAIDFLRLENAAVQKMATDEYVELAELALQAGFPTEAKKVVDQGFAAGALGTGANAAKHRQLRDRATKGAADDAKNIANTEASAAKAKTGAGLVNLGWAYVTMDQYDKGIGFIQQGIAKGGLKHPDEAKLRLGMAYAKAGKKDEAIKTFQSVTAGAGLSDMAKYWITLVNHPSK
jgi:tetratricopeptide (TPR) repeat protein